MSKGFYELPMEETSQNYTAFSTPIRSFKRLRMPMGLTGSPLTFQSLMKKVHVRLNWTFSLSYLDVSIIFSRTIEEHLDRLREVFQRFKDANLKTNPTKCEPFRRKYPFWATLSAVKTSKPVLRQLQPLTITLYQRTLPRYKVFQASVDLIEDLRKTLQT